MCLKCASYSFQSSLHPDFMFSTPELLLTAKQALQHPQMAHRNDSNGKQKAATSGGTWQRPDNGQHPPKAEDGQKGKE